MTTSLFVASLLAALPVFMAAMFLWWQALADEALEIDMVDVRFLLWDRPPESAAESTRPQVVSTTSPWPLLAVPLVATAAR